MTKAIIISRHSIYIFLINMFFIICHINCIQQTYVLYKKYGFFAMATFKYKEGENINTKIPYSLFHVTVWSFTETTFSLTIGTYRGMQNISLWWLESLKYHQSVINAHIRKNEKKIYASEYIYDNKRVWHKNRCFWS